MEISMSTFFSLFQEGLFFSTFPNKTVALTVCVISVLGCIIIPYLLGSINSAIVVSKLFFNEDVRTHGSGNAGTTNVMRTYGKKAALFTLLGDILKTVIAVLIGGLFMGLYYGKYAFSVGLGGYIAGFFCIVGHIWPIYYRFRGGKGVLCLATVVGMLSPIVLLPLLLIFILLVAFARYISLGSVISALIYPLFLNRIALFFGHPINGLCLLLGILEALLIVFCHRSNIKRIMAGEENKFSFKSKR